MKTLLTSLLSLYFLFSIAQEGADTQLWEAIKANNVEGIDAAVQAGADINQAYEATVHWHNSFYVTDGDKVTPLMFAVLNGHYEATLKLIHLGAKPNKMTNISRAGAIALPPSFTYKDGYCTAKKMKAATALYFAIDQNKPELVKLLLITKKFAGAQPLSIYSVGKCISLGKGAVMDGAKCTTCGNEAMINPKKFAQLLGHDEIAALFKKYKKSEWFLAGLPEL